MSLLCPANLEIVMSIYSPYPDNERDKQIDEESNRFMLWCLSISFGLLVIACVIGAIV